MTGATEATWRLNGLGGFGDPFRLLKSVVARFAVTAVDAALLYLHDGHTKGYKPKAVRNDRRVRVEGALIGIGRAGHSLKLKEVLVA